MLEEAYKLRYYIFYQLLRMVAISSQICPCPIRSCMPGVLPFPSDVIRFMGYSMRSTDVFAYSTETQGSAADGNSCLRLAAFRIKLESLGMFM